MSKKLQEQIQKQDELLRFFRKENNNLKHDIKQLINIITSARVAGRWDIEGARFRDVTPEQVFGTIQQQLSQSLNYSSGDLRSLTDQVKQCDDTIDRLQKDLEFVTRRKRDLERQISELKSQVEGSGYATALEESDIDEMAAALDIKSDGEEDQTFTRLEVSGRRKGPSIRQLNVRLDRQINIKHDEDKRGCWITGSTVIGTTRIAVVDCNNDSTKLIDIQNNVILSYLKLESIPWDITQTDQGQLVVTCPLIQSLLFINVVGDTLRLDRQHNVGGACRGIDYGNDVLIVSFVNPNLVKLIKMDGQTVRTISTDSSGQPLFDNPRYVVFSTDSQSVYVSDYNKASITHLDINGVVLGVYTSNDLKRPQGVTVDRHNNVYIAWSGSHNICVLTAGGTQIQPVVKVDYPQSVLVCDDSDQMIVGHYVNTKHSDKLSIYRMH